MYWENEVLEGYKKILKNQILKFFRKNNKKKTNFKVIKLFFKYILENKRKYIFFKI